jgi:CelD/BcsL family acetyltransferase involved in cellulose biosynthesis
MIAPASALIELPVETEVLGGDFSRRQADWSEIGPRKVYIVDPLCDPRWDGFLRTHPRASLFHSSGWLRALATTYGYRPVAYTTSGFDEPLRNAAVFCEIESWMTGKRLVSLPFSDHSDWLVDQKEDSRSIWEALQQSMQQQRWRHIELRPLRPIGMPVWPGHTRVKYSFHALDLRPNLETIFTNFHKSSIQRKIRRAEREGLIYCEGSSERLLDQFYDLLCITRKRHRLPPQPKQWFANLMQYVGDGVKIRVVLRDGCPVAAMITVRYKNTMIYKYGCSDKQLNRLGGNHLLFWNAIQDAKRSGLLCFDFGRADADQQGLITFKKRWGAAESILTYSRYSIGSSSVNMFDLPAGTWKTQAAKFVLSCLPSRMVVRIGQAFYGHAG